MTITYKNLDNSGTKEKNQETGKAALPILCRVLSWTHLLLFSAGLSLLLLLAVAIIGSQSRGLSQKVTSLESTMKEREQVLKTGLSEVTEHVQQLGKQLKALECQLDSLRTNGSAKACCPPPWLQHGGSCYWFSQAQKSWAEADRACQLENAHLVVVNSLDEQHFIQMHLASVVHWMGLMDQNGPWQWVDGTDYKKGFRYWAPEQPDNWHGHGLGGGEDCAQFTSDGLWNDDACQRHFRWICETDLTKESPAT